MQNHSLALESKPKNFLSFLKPRKKYFTIIVETRDIHRDQQTYVVRVTWDEFNRLKVFQEVTICKGWLMFDKRYYLQGNQRAGSSKRCNCRVKAK